MTFENEPYMLSFAPCGEKAHCLRLKFRCAAVA